MPDTGHCQTEAPRQLAQQSRPSLPSATVPMSTSIIVTIDGPAGTGKSTVAHELASRLGLDVLDTGAMYRAAAAIVLDSGIDPGDYDAVLARVADADLHFDWSQSPPPVLAWLKPMESARLRRSDVTSLVSRLAAIGPLRTHMVRKQRLIAQQHPRLVTEGRDQGSVVFPDASIKFYLDADPRVRARRRAEQLSAQGEPISAESLLPQILERDRLDTTRTDGPLVCPEDAVRINTTDMSFNDVVDRLERDVHAHLSSQAGGA